MVALFRPGPMDSIPQYIERKHNPQMISYLDPRMKEYLGASYGLLVYQDDVLLTSINIAGYSWLEADKLRKAMGKKIPAEMEAQREKFIKGAHENGMSESKAEKMWKLIEPFAAYGFGKAHAASYGKVAYQTAYMKANYRVEYMAAVLTAEAGDIDTVSVMVNECKRMEVPVLPPDVNESFGVFTVVLGGSSERTEKAAALASDAEEDAIRFGLYSIKNFRQRHRRQYHYRAQSRRQVYLPERFPLPRQRPDAQQARASKFNRVRSARQLGRARGYARLNRAPPYLPPRCRQRAIARLSFFGARRRSYRA